MSQEKLKQKPSQADSRYAKTEQEAIRRADEWLLFYGKQDEAHKRLYQPTAELVADLVAFLRSKQTEEEIIRNFLGWNKDKVCVQCSKKVEKDRRCFAQPTCHGCLPPPPPIDEIQV